MTSDELRPKAQMMVVGNKGYTVVLLSDAEAALAECEREKARLLKAKEDGFCEHLEVLCGNCTGEKGFSIWHRPPVCEDAALAALTEAGEGEK